MINSTLIIGITGNIATGKSVIRRMLTNVGVFGIDADVLANRMLYPGGSAYQAVIEAFGPAITSDQGHISNSKLGQIVFNDPERLKQLETLVHPPVVTAIVKRIKAARRPVASIEAIKLLESSLGTYCDHIWVSHASYAHQVQRLLRSRGLSENEANARITAQPSQAEKLARADVVINTEISFKDTWLRTCDALNDTIHSEKFLAPLHFKISQDWSGTSVNALPFAQLESAWDKFAGDLQVNLYECLGLYMTLVVMKGEQVQAFILWENWNFTGTLKEIYPAGFINLHPDVVLQAFETHAQRHQIEILLLDKALVSALGNQAGHLGYDHLQNEQITYPAWQMAAQRAAVDDASSPWSKVLSPPYEIKIGFNS